MKTIKLLTVSGLMLFFVSNLPTAQAKDFRSVIKNSLLQDRYKRFLMIFPDHPVSPEPLLSGRKNPGLTLKSGTTPVCRLDNLVNYYWEPVTGSWEANYRQDYIYNRNHL